MSNSNPFSFLAMAMAAILLVLVIFMVWKSGSISVRNQIMNECQNFHATVINGKKFRCEEVKS